MSIGNVGQLSTDILLASLPGVRKLAELWHPSLLPIVGSNPLDDREKDLMTACQRKALV